MLAMRAEQKTVALNDFCHYVMSNYCHHFAEGPSLSKTNKHFLFIGLLYNLAYHVRCLVFTLVFYMTSWVLFLVWMFCQLLKKDIVLFKIKIFWDYFTMNDVGDICFLNKYVTKKMWSVTYLPLLLNQSYDIIIP